MAENRAELVEVMARAWVRCDLKCEWEWLTERQQQTWLKLVEQFLNAIKADGLTVINAAATEDDAASFAEVWERYHDTLSASPFQHREG